MTGASTKKSTILVTGGAGFIGSHITDELLSRDNEVVVVDDLSTGRRENINPLAEFQCVDVSDEKGLISVFDGRKIDYVIHQAGKINLNVMLEDTVKDVKSSVLGTLNVLRCCSEYKVKKLIYASSVAVYGRAKKLPVSETDELSPIYSYGIAKKCAEEYVRYYSKYYGLNYTILRYANVYGPRQPIYGEVGVIAIYTDRILRGEPLIVYGDGAHLRDYIFIEDVVNMTVKMLSLGDNETFNIGLGMGVSVRDVFDQFCSLSGEKLQSEHKPEREGELGFFYCDISKVVNAAGYIPQIPIREGINRTLSYYKDKLLKADPDGISLRAILPEDKKLIFEWRNNPDLYRLGSSGRGVTWEEHNRWFEAVLYNKQTVLLVINLGGRPIGQVRFDLKEERTYTVSIYLLEEYRSRGIGAKALRQGLEWMNKEDRNRRYIALIKKGNNASQAVFSKTGFEESKDYDSSPTGHIVMICSPEKI